ncbi:hypothetical protein ES706_03941 [subsurface metagenome]
MTVHHRIYTDASVNQQVVDLLRQLGWDIETAQQANLTGKIDDVAWVIYAREHNRIAITFDELRAEQGERVARELRQNGGHIIRIQGGPEQDKYRAVGKLLFHYPDWYPFLTNNNGVSIIADVRTASCRNCTPEEYHQKYHPTDAEQFNRYLKKRKLRPYKPRPRKRKPPPDEQSILT